MRNLFSDYSVFDDSIDILCYNTTFTFGFNGKENDAETSTQDYGMRIYNPGLGRFLSVDPLASSFAYYSPYEFAGNKPIWCIDLDGAEPWIATNNAQDVFSFDSWQNFLDKRVPELVAEGKEDYDCADFILLMIIEYHREMGVELVLTIPKDDGKTLIYSSSDENLTYELYVEYIRTWSNAFYVNNNLATPIPAGTEQQGDLYKNMGHTMMVWPDAANTDAPNEPFGYVQSSGSWPDNAAPVNFHSNAWAPGSPARLNFLINVPLVQPTFIEPIPIPLIKNNISIPLELSMPDQSQSSHTSEEGNNNSGTYGGPSFY